MYKYQYTPFYDVTDNVSKELKIYKEKTSQLSQNSIDGK